MTASLPPYSHTGGCCPKCGDNQAKTRWRPADSHPHGIDAPGPSGLPERQERTCRNCHYPWDEACLDSKDTSVEA